LPRFAASGRCPEQIGEIFSGWDDSLPVPRASGAQQAQTAPILRVGSFWEGGQRQFRLENSRKAGFRVQIGQLSGGVGSAGAVSWSIGVESRSTAAVLSSTEAVSWSATAGPWSAVAVPWSAGSQRWSAAVEPPSAEAVPWSVATKPWSSGAGAAVPEGTTVGSPGFQSRAPSALGFPPRRTAPSCRGTPPKFYYGQPWLWRPSVKWIAACGHLLIV